VAGAFSLRPFLRDNPVYLVLLRRGDAPIVAGEQLPFLPFYKSTRSHTMHRGLWAIAATCFLTVAGGHASTLWCTVMDGSSVLSTQQVTVTPHVAEDCRAVAETMQHNGHPNANFKMQCRIDANRWSDTGINPNSDDPVVRGCS
jgi:hypothetical protein